MKVAVVGGGLGGLAAAHGLVAAGFDAHVIEAASSQVASSARARSTGSCASTRRARSSAVRRAVRSRCARSLASRSSKASPRAKRRWIYIDGKLRALPR